MKFLISNYQLSLTTLSCDLCLYSVDKDDSLVGDDDAIGGVVDVIDGISDFDDVIADSCGVLQGSVSDSPVKGFTS